ncbi:hypothetical protein [Streptomyces indicus]|uniref:Uncharacterized protein n=1 Tax=Streptomyces indicus TaxID=417292 RepID=A0A1G9ITP6_9ACTN|nr:hypothetical protein [Streptomyces indicus]SDL28540.1 hypothetical protein SAMN05421806_12563 [Streptomyces indicus]
MSGRPDYEKIARLERELGIGQPEPAGRIGPRVCLTKDCEGETEEARTWSGLLIRISHQCEPQ